MDIPLHGTVAPEFAGVQEAFRENFVSDGEVGASLHIIRHGEPVVDLWGGWREAERTSEWEADTLVDIYSVGKGILATLLLRLVDSGKIGLDDPIATVWPEFATGGKESATVEHALTHRAGVPAIRELLTDDDLFDWQRMTSAIAATESWYRPGERLVYHTNTFGHILGEIVHRVSGEMPGAQLARLTDELAADLYFGVPPESQARCAQVIWDPPREVVAPPGFAGLDGDVLMNALAHLNPPGYSSIGVVNTTRWRSSQIGSTSGHASARGIARIYAALLEPGRIMSPALLSRAASPQVTGECPILGMEVTFGLGFQPTTPKRPLGPNRRSFGHFGTGGALGFADPDSGIAFGYAMNHVIPRWQSSRNRRLIDSLYDSLAAL